MHHVYIIRSIPYPFEYYVGYTADLKERLISHNQGGSPHTSRHKPWIMVFSCDFSNKNMALDFEKYLKSHSGKAFAYKHFL